jgi:hypothetical protein
VTPYDLKVLAAKAILVPIAAYSRIMMWAAVTVADDKRKQWEEAHGSR